MKQCLLFTTGSVVSFLLAYRSETYLNTFSTAWRVLLPLLLLTAGPILSSLIGKPMMIRNLVLGSALLVVAYTAIFVSRASGNDSPRWSPVRLEAGTVIAAVQVIAYGAARRGIAIRQRNKTRR